MKIFTTIVLLWTALYQSSVECRNPITGGDVLNSIGTIIQGVGEEIPNLIPTPDELFQLPVELLFGLPEVAVFTTINQLCSVYLASGEINPRITPEGDELFLQLRTPCKTSTFPLLQAEQVFQSPDFDANNKVVIFVSGWMTRPNETYINDMAKAYNCRGANNFFVLDTSDFIRTLYSWSAFNTEALGRYLAQGLQKIAERVPVENIHIIGHSLGAHIVGYAGRYFTRFTGKQLTRITGLDPANPCYNDGENLGGLQRNDAKFIDIIHSNPGVLGKPTPTGDVDFYAGGLAPIKPGCSNLGCSHNHAVSYYTETVYPGNETDFLGTMCTSLAKVENGFCHGPQYPMGYAVPYNLKGNYFLAVNKDEPYGQNANGEGTMTSSACGRCPNE